MPRQCTVCASPRRADIEQALAAGESSRDVAARHGLSHGAIQRHQQHAVDRPPAKPHPRPPPAPAQPPSTPKDPSQPSELNVIARVLLAKVRDEHESGNTTAIVAASRAAIVAIEADARRMREEASSARDARDARISELMAGGPPALRAALASAVARLDALEAIDACAPSPRR